MNRTVRYLDFLVYWMIVLLPFSIAISIGAANTVIGFLIFCFFVKRIIAKERLFPQTGINLPLLIFFIITCVSIINSVDLRDSFRGGVLRLLQFVYVFFAVTQGLKDKRHLSLIIFSAITGIFLVSLDAVWQVFAGKDFIRGYVPIYNIGLVRATASFSDANTLGIYLSAFMPFALGLALYYFKGRKKGIFLFISAILLAGAALTYSRPTLLAIYAVLWFFAVAKKDKLLAVILIITTLISPFLLPKSVKDWAKFVDYNPVRFMCNDDRIAVFMHSANMIREHPLIGVGVNTYMKNYKDYKNSPEYRGVVTSDNMFAHNNFLHMAAEIGLSGLAVFIWLLFALFSSCVKICKKINGGFLKIAALAAIACLIAFLVNGLTESSLFYPREAVIFWYLAGLVLGMKKLVS